MGWTLFSVQSWYVVLCDRCYGWEGKEGTDFYFFEMGGGVAEQFPKNVLALQTDCRIKTIMQTGTMGEKIENLLSKVANQKRKSLHNLEVKSFIAQPPPPPSLKKNNCLSLIFTQVFEWELLLSQHWKRLQVNITLGICSCGLLVVSCLH